MELWWRQVYLDKVRTSSTRILQLTIVGDSNLFLLVNLWKQIASFLGVTWLIKQQISCFWWLLNVRCETIKIFYGTSIDLVHHVIIKKEPESMTFNDTNIMATICIWSTMNHDSSEVIHSVRIHSIIRLERKCNVSYGNSIYWALPRSGQETQTLQILNFLV